jgi:hypothetical protein
LQSDVAGTVADRLGGAFKSRLYLWHNWSYWYWIGSWVCTLQARIFGRANATLTNFEVDQTGSAFAYNVSSVNYKEEQTLGCSNPSFSTIQNNINTGVDFNFRAGVKYFFTVNYKLKLQQRQ